MQLRQAPQQERKRQMLILLETRLLPMHTFYRQFRCGNQLDMHHLHIRTSCTSGECQHPRDTNDTPTLNILQLNCNGIGGKIPEIVACLNAIDIELAAIQEFKLFA